MCRRFPMNIVERLTAWRPAPLPKGREFERPPAWKENVAVGARRASPETGGDSTTTGDARVAPTTSTSIICPRCNNRAELEPQVCGRCGFPFVCDTAPVDQARIARRTTTWRTILAAGALLFWLTSAGIVVSGSEAYQGLSSNVAIGLSTTLDSGIPVTGPQAFIARTNMALDLLHKRAPDYYYRMQQSVTSIDYLGEALIDERTGKRITLEGIGALSTPSTGQVQVLVTTAFPSGLGELTDADVFSYAGVLIHELRHIELHRSGDAPGGWQEEVRCEEAAYAALLKMEAPGSILANYQMYLRNPHAERYQQWYDWYDQF
jgi:hypothetical protein